MLSASNQCIDKISKMGGRGVGNFSLRSKMPSQSAKRSDTK